MIHQTECDFSQITQKSDSRMEHQPIKNSYYESVTGYEIGDVTVTSWVIQNFTFGNFHFELINGTTGWILDQGDCFELGLDIFEADRGEHFGEGSSQTALKFIDQF